MKRMMRTERAKRNRRTLLDIMILAAVIVFVVAMGHASRGYWAIGPEVMIAPLGALIVWERRHRWTR